MNKPPEMDGQAPAIEELPPTLPPEGHAWCVLHSRPRCEKKLATWCRDQGWFVYLPLRHKTHQYGSRIRAFTSPLFTGYLFGIVPAARAAYVRQNRHVANLLAVVDQARLLDQLRQIRIALASGDCVEVLPFLEAGRPVRVVAGPFRGLEGIITRIKGHTRVVLNVDMIQQSVAVEVDSAWLEPA